MAGLQGQPQFAPSQLPPQQSPFGQVQQSYASPYNQQPQSQPPPQLRPPVHVQPQQQQQQFYFNPMDRLAYLEQQCQTLFNDNALQYSGNQQLTKENQEQASRIESMRAENKKLDQHITGLTSQLEGHKKTIAEQQTQIVDWSIKNADLTIRLERRTKPPMAHCDHCFASVKYNMAICHRCSIPCLSVDRFSKKNETKITVNLPDDSSNDGDDVYISDTEIEDDEQVPFHTRD